MGTKRETTYSETAVAFIFVILLYILYCIATEILFLLKYLEEKITKYRTV